MSYDEQEFHIKWSEAKQMSWEAFFMGLFVGAFISFTGTMLFVSFPISVTN